MTELRTVAVIGASPLGLELALLAARAGFPTILEDVLPSNLRRAHQQAAGRSADRLTLASSIEDAVRDADLILDSVPDELESKLEIFSLLDRMAPPRSILLTPTWTLSIADLAACTYRAERCLACDWEGNAQTPPAQHAAVRVLHTRHTAPEALAAALLFWRKLERLPSFLLDPVSLAAD